MGAQLIDETELDDFVRGVKDIGYKVKDFVVTASPQVDVRLPSGQFAMRQEVTVQRRSAEMSRTYHGGHGYAWAAAALFDIENGVFGAR